MRGSLLTETVNRMAGENYEVRPFHSAAQYEAMIDYFLLADDVFLRGMGVERNKLPRRDTWLRDVLADHERPDDKKERFYLAWIYKGEQAGHSSINKIRMGEEAYFHLHLWRPDLRKAGLGTEFSKRCVNFYFERFQLKRLFCEPFAENPGPNKVLPKLGFKFIQRYVTVPGPLNGEQEVNRYVLAVETVHDGI
jgi:RimJ/RimL family protein N-acetyltransferase